MQLTILLSLIHSRGSSLPDKRTALYDSYVDLFFNREAEKTPVVKKYRDLLLDIHKYIAWVLHAEAEQHGRNGSITQEELHSNIRLYLEKQGYAVDLASELVAGALERIVALVSRVEGTYEFEVQPLREYFAARYLYETARHSSPGKEYSGTKPDRFDAIARNFYWLNVTRFYAGCYDVGELPSLIDRLEDLICSEGYCLISHPRILAATLLSDWVFSQHPKSVRKVMNLILDGIGLRYVLPSASRRMGQSEPMVLPPECGRDELINHCFNLLGSQPPLDFALDIINLLSANILSSEIFDLWFARVVGNSDKTRIKWLEYGLYLGILSQSTKLSLTQLESICPDSSDDPDRLVLLYRASRFDYFEAKEERFSAGIRLVLNNDCFQSHRQNRRPKKASLLEIMSFAVNARPFAFSFREPRPVPLLQLWQGRFHPREGYFSEDFLAESSSQYPRFEDTQKCLAVISVIKQDLQLDARLWSTNILPWNNLVEVIRQHWGDVWICFHLANVASGVKSSTEKYKEFSELLDHSKDLCKRARYARLRAGQYSWWIKQVEAAKDEIEIAFTLLVLITWASSKTLERMIPQIDELTQRISNPTWEKLYNSVEESLDLTQSSERNISLDIHQIGDSLNPKTVILISLRAKPNTRKSLYSKYLKEYNGSDTSILKLCHNMSLEFLAIDYSMWEEVRNVIQRSYAKGVVFEPYFFHRLNREITSQTIPNDVAQEIVSNPSAYPGFLVAIGEMKLKEIVASKVVPVGETAIKDKWFEHL